MNRREFGAVELLSGRSGIWLMVVGILATCVPLLTVSMPPVMDYPNHLVRIWLLAGGATQRPLFNVFAIDWSQASTNVGVDWIAVGMVRWLPFDAVDRLLRCAMFLGPPLGAIWLARTVWGRLTVWQFASLIFVWSATSIAGFVNFSISLAAALVFAAVLQRRRAAMDPLTLALHAVFAVVLLALHPFGLLFYAALIAAIVIGPDSPFPLKRERLRLLTVRAFVLAAIAIAPVILLFFLTSSPPRPGAIVYYGSHFQANVLGKLVLSPVTTYYLPADLLFVLPIGIIVVLLAARRTMAVHFGLCVVAALLLVAACIVPNEFGDASWLDRRLPIMAALMLQVGVQPVLPNARWQTAMAGALMFAVVGKAGWIQYIWMKREQDIVDLRAVTGRLRPGDAIMTVKAGTENRSRVPLGRLLATGYESARAHLPLLLIKEKRVFIPTLFAMPGQQPIRVKALARAHGQGLSSYVPEASVIGTATGEGYIRGWRCRYRYLLLIGADEPNDKPIDTRGLSLVASQGFAALYALDRLPPGASCDLPPG